QAFEQRERAPGCQPEVSGGQLVQLGDLLQILPADEPHPRVKVVHGDRSVSYLRHHVGIGLRDGQVWRGKCQPEAQRKRHGDQYPSLANPHRRYPFSLIRFAVIIIGTENRKTTLWAFGSSRRASLLLPAL